MISEEGDFDRHSIAIAKAFGFSKSLSAFGMLFSNELKEPVEYGFSIPLSELQRDSWTM